MRYTDELRQRPGTGEYLSGYPVVNAGPYLEKMQNSIKRISSTSYYTTFLLDPQHRLTPENLSNVDLADVSYATLEFNSTAAGTAVVIHNFNNRIAFLTANHVVSSPDTIFTFQVHQGERVLETVSIRKEQVKWLFEAAYMGSFDILARDELADLAIIGAPIDRHQIDEPLEEVFPIFPYPLGRPHRLVPGSFVYGLGYPRGYPVVTSGIVSQPNRDRHHSFITDLLFNPGFSGGAVVAVNGGIPAFEWVGMARSSSATREWVIVPDDEQLLEPVLQTYDDILFAEQKTRIDYGITHVVSATRIRDFLQREFWNLSRMGYPVQFK